MLIGASSALAACAAAAAAAGTAPAAERTMLAVAGRSSAASAIRVGLQRQQLAVGARASRTCSAPGAKPGTKISHTPHSRRSRIGWRRPSQWLKSPTTLTRAARSAPTPRSHAGHAVELRGMRAQHLVGPQVRAFGQQPDVHLAEHRGEAVGVLEQPADRPSHSTCSR